VGLGILLGCSGQVEVVGTKAGFNSMARNCCRTTVSRLLD
jgi:hypothetical protein